MVETVYCEACHYVSQIIFFLHPFPVDHCIGNVKAFLYRVPFTPRALVAVPHTPVCAAEAFAFSGPLLGRFPWLRHIRIGIVRV